MCKAVRQIQATGSIDGTISDPVEAKLRLAFVSAKNSARKKKLKGLLFNISPTSLREIYDLQNGLCAVSGRPLGLDIRQGGPGARQPGDLSVDRIDSSRGYEKDNVRLVTLGVNIALQHWGDAAFLGLCRDVVAFADTKREPAAPRAG